MKNKFKKSKIIVPALALITATTAASVTGTVAWFTATRAVTVTAGNFVSTKLESKLTVTNSALVGTTVSGNTITVDGNLTHGSYNAIADKTGSLYVANINDTNTNTIDSYTDLGDVANANQTSATTTIKNWLARIVTSGDTTTNIWYGVAWTMTFKLETATTGQTDYLLFDVKDSTFTDNSTTSEANKTAPGFRIAFMTGSKFLVVGGDDTKTHTVSTNVTKSLSEFTNYAKIHDGDAKLADNASTLTSSILNLGTVGSTDATALTVTCVAWYEGSDANVVDKISNNQVGMSSIEASLNFYTRYKTNSPSGNN